MLLGLIAVPITIQLCPIWVCISLIALFPLVSAVGKVRPTDFLRDLKPIAIYSAMIIMIDILSFLFFHTGEEIVTKRSLYLVLKLLCAIEATSVFFRTTSTFEIRDCLQNMEKAVTFGRSSLVLSSMFALFLTFLPQIFATWTSLDLAYRSRGGRRGLAKAFVLIPLLVTMSIKRAGTTYLALLNRS